MYSDRIALLPLILLCAITIGACTEDPVFPAQPLSVRADNLPVLSDGARYELWLSYPHEYARGKNPGIEHNELSYVSAGQFTVDAQGALRSVDGSAPAALAIPQGHNPSLIGEAMVTVEAARDTDSLPGARFLWGAVTGTASTGTATLTLVRPHTFDSEALFAVSGTFMLEAPTSPELGDQLSGIWFASHQSGSIVNASLVLPPLPLIADNDRWVYEAWLGERSSASTVYRSLGRFRRTDAPDSNGAGPEAGPNSAGAYRVPGEDFVMSRRRLSDTALSVVVSLQPQDVPMTTPLLRVLELTRMPGDATSGTDIMLSPALPSRVPEIEITIAR